MIVTVTINQWVIKANQEHGKNDPVICVNKYVEVPGERFGPKWGETLHSDELVIPDCAQEVRVIHDSQHKTPCGASCWIEFRI